MKRFTETTKWQDPWFRKLSPEAKLLWIFITDHCDCTGVLEPDLESAAFYSGAAITKDHLKELGDRVELSGCKLIIPKFIKFQYGELTPQCPPHRGVIKAVNQRSLLRDDAGYHLPAPGTSAPPADSTPEAKLKANAKKVLATLNEYTGREFREVDSNLTIISARLKEPGVTLEGVQKMIARQCARWKTDPIMSEYLRPETLFGKSKFDGYYAAKDLPVTDEVKPTGKSKLEKAGLAPSGPDLF